MHLSSPSLVVELAILFAIEGHIPYLEMPRCVSAPQGRVPRYRWAQTLI